MGGLEGRGEEAVSEITSLADKSIQVGVVGVFTVRAGIVQTLAVFLLRLDLLLRQVGGAGMKILEIDFDLFSDAFLLLRLVG